MQVDLLLVLFISCDLIVEKANTVVHESLRRD